MAIHNEMRIKVSLLLLALTLTVSAQEIRVKGVSRVKPEDNGSYLLTGVVPGSSLLLVTGDGYKGLSMLNTRRGRITVISTDPGAGYEPAVTADGQRVIFRTDNISYNRKYSSVFSYDIRTQDRKLMMDAERGVLPPAVSGNAVLLKSDGETRIENPAAESLKSTGDELFVVIEEMTPVLYRGGERMPLKPSGEGYYIWVSLSPDGSMILYNFQGRDTYICDTGGKVLHELGRVNAPRWLDNRIVIGMDDRDDGHMITSSELVYYSLTDRKRSELTNTENRSEMFPYAFGGGKKIAFSTDKGEIFVMKIRIR